jgi:hypothetical protein
MSTRPCPLRSMSAPPSRAALSIPAIWALIVVFVVAGAARAADPRPREIEIRIDGGHCWPTGDWREMMEPAGAGLSESVGLLLAFDISSRVDIGFEAAYQRLGVTDAYRELAMGLSFPRPVGVDDWKRYTGALRIAGTVLAHKRYRLFAAGTVGMHGVVIRKEWADGYSVGNGDYGLGLGVEIGWQLRFARRWGTHLAARAEMAPGLEPKSAFVSLRAGVSVFL